MAANSTPKKDSTEMAVNVTPKEDSPEKAELAADQEDFDLVVTEAPEKVNLNSGA